MIFRELRARPQSRPRKDPVNRGVIPSFAGAAISRRYTFPLAFTNASPLAVRVTFPLLEVIEMSLFAAAEVSAGLSNAKAGTIA